MKIVMISGHACIRVQKMGGDNYMRKILAALYAITILCMMIFLTSCETIKNAGVNLTSIGGCALEMVECVVEKSVDVPKDIMDDSGRALGLIKDKKDIETFR